MTIYKIPVMSTSSEKVNYEIVVDTEKVTVNCDCIGGRIHGRCKHIKFYKKLISQMLGTT